MTGDYLEDLRDFILESHNLTIREHGGLPTFKDRGIFELCVARPWMSAFGEEAYKTPFEKAAAITEAIVCNHPFNDANHRTALAATHIVLRLHGMSLVSSDADLKDVIMKLGEGEMNIETFSSWVEQRSVLSPPPQ